MNDIERVIERVDFQIPMQPKALRVCAYARVSSGKDAMLHSLSAQVSYYNNLIQSHAGWLYCGVYSDEAITGTKSQRDGFQRMLASCRAGEIDLIITKSLSRFARNTVDCLETVRLLKANGIGVYFEKENINTLDSTSEVILTIYSALAQEESRKVSERVRAGKTDMEDFYRAGKLPKRNPEKRNPADRILAGRCFCFRRGSGKDLLLYTAWKRAYRKVGIAS